VSATLSTPRTQVRRLPKRGVYERDTINAILDEGFICHLGFPVEGQPYVIPTGYARSGDQVYVHGSAASRMLRELISAVPMCLTVTLLDGLVLARSAFHHSMNYRSVVVLAQARQVNDPAEKLEALKCFTNHVLPGRWDHVRLPTEQELKATNVISLPLNEASAKIRTGPPVDDEPDYALHIWAGIIPLRLAAGSPTPDARLQPDIPSGRYLIPGVTVTE
jgi:nitroimidazol reductase NimA-like FMN-containing flavoprotein (pyridoxamine 5'-phosphate oxidase superfamily)